MKCNTCNTEYTPMPMMEETDQADGCAATLYLHDGTYYILAHYGSRFDMRKYALKKARYEVGHICDNCIGSMLDKGVAQMIEDGIW